jgi:ERCC4-related helicase
VEGAAVAGKSALGGLIIPPQEMLPFSLAARSVVNARQDLLGEALCSSYEAFRFTRKSHDAAKDDEEDSTAANSDFAQSRWYLGEFDRALTRSSGLSHPKMDVTVKKVVDLWQSGEKVLVFAFYRHTCRALRIHISQEIERRIMTAGQDVLREAGRGIGVNALKQLLENIQKRYFDVLKSPGRRAVDAALRKILERHSKAIKYAQMTDEQEDLLLEVMRRFLRATSTIVRCFPIAKPISISPVEAVSIALNHADSSGDSWWNKFERFIEFLTAQCSVEERKLYLEAARGTQTGGIRVGDGEREDTDLAIVTLANVQVATGSTRRDARARLMRSFNTPFSPDILVCSQVMGEGVDLQRFCRHVVHHDLAWNPSTIEQRTGRIDRIGCKAEGRQPILVYLPYLAGAADERQYRVMSDREQWFRIVMGQEDVARLITPDSTSAVPLSDAISRELSFKLNVVASLS